MVDVLKFKSKLEEFSKLDCPMENDEEMVLKKFNETTKFENG